MSLNILNLTPVNGSINIPIDSTFLVEFDSPVDPFTIINGISIYTISDGLWSGPDSAILENHDGITGSYLQSNFTYTIQDNKVLIKPTNPLLPEKTYFITILPGNDTTRFVSSATASTPIITSESESASCEVVSSYIGATSETFIIDIGVDNKIDVTKGTQYLGEFSYIIGQDVDLGELKISLSGGFSTGDNIEIHAFPASGLSQIYKTSFETSKYTTLQPQSQSLTSPPGNILDQLVIPLQIVSTIPEDLSANNLKCNPIIVKFNKNLNLTDNISDKITIKKISIDNSKTSSVSFYYKIDRNILKIYMASI